MNVPKPISKTNASFPEYLSFQVLREQGIAHCQALGSDLWTDFNLHDPGLTILEALCYALTDLGYRTNLPIEELLARSPEKRTADAAAAVPAGGPCAKPDDDNFFTPEQILTCNPVTMLDLRKLLIDVPGVKNAWLERADAAEVAIYLNAETTSLQVDVPEDLAGDAKAIAEATVTPDGLYVVCLELDGEEQADACGALAVPVDRILGDVWTLLHRHRNLCEDFVDVVILGDEDIALCADVEIDVAADPDEVLLQMVQQLEAFLSPTLAFYTLQEMLARGKGIEEIYAGRPLTPLAALVDRAASEGESAECSHGFIDTDELIATERRSQLHASDLYQVIMDVPGVLAVRKLLAVNYVNGVPQTRGEKWCLHLTPKHRQRFDLLRSQIQFFKGLLPFSPDKDRVAQRYKEERKARTKAPLEAHQLDLPVPEGRYRDLRQYRSIVHEFPLVYGIGEGGVPESATGERKAQVRQLRAYLLFYDQILANYLAQLANVRELFSMRSVPGARTYFTQVLRDVPGIEELLQNYNRCQVEEGYPPVPENYPGYLQYLAESRETYHARRNRFLDHVLARFAESFTDYVLLMFDVNGRRNDERILRDKTGFLSTYPETSRDRGKGFDTTDPVGWSTNNVSGLEKRVARLLGLGDTDCRSTAAPLRRRLSHTRVVEVEGGWHWRVELSPFGGGDSVTLTSRLGFRRKADARAALEAFRERARDERNYRRLAYEDDPGAGALTPEHGFAVVAENGEMLVEVDPPWPDRETRDLYLYGLIELAIGLDISCDVDQETECFYYRLLDARRETVLFAGVRGYPTESEALAAFERQFLPRALDEEGYRDLDGGDFGFELLAEPGGVLVARLRRDIPVARLRRDVLATHPHRYATAVERELRQLAVLYYLQQPEIRTAVDGEPGAFSFEVRDVSGELLFESAVPYDSSAAAAAGYRELLELARRRASYRLLDEFGDERPYGFELLGADGEVLARHPTAYETEVDRDLAVDYLVRLFCPVEDVRHEIEEQDGGYSVALLAEDGRALLVSPRSHDTEEEARDTLRILLETARRRDRYLLIDDDGAYGFVLHDEADQVLAVHPATYANDFERDRALCAVIAYVCPVDVTYSIDGEPGRFHYLLFHPTGGTDREIFRSIESYPDESSARHALGEFLAWAVDPGRYCPIDEDGAFGFELLGDGKAVAEHPDRYVTADERDAAIAMIVAYLSRAQIQSQVVNPTGAFRFELRDESGDVVLAATRAASSVDHAQAAYRVALALARDRERYRRTDDGPDGCPFGFEVADENGVALARDPRHYPSEDRRDDAMARLYALVHDGGTIPDVVWPDDEVPGRYFYQLVDFDGDRLLRSTAHWPSAEQAETAFRREFAPLAGTASSYRRIHDNKQCTYTFELRRPPANATPCVPNEGILLAEHGRTYPLPRLRDEQRLRAVDLVRAQPCHLEFPGVACGHTFRLLGADHELVGTSYYSTAARAAAACTRLLPHLADPEAYLIEPVDDESHRLYLASADGRVRAASAPGEHDALVAMRVELIALAAEEVELPHEIEETRSELRCRLSDAANETLLESAHGYPAEVWARVDGFESRGPRNTAMRETQGFFAETEEPPVRIEEIDGDFYFAFDLSEELAVSSRWTYSTEQEARDGSEEFLLLAGAAENYRPRDVGPRELAFEIFDRNRAEENRRQACEDCNAFVERILDPEGFRLVTGSEACAHGFWLVGADLETLARSPRLFATAEERDEYIRAVTCLADGEGFHLVEHLLLRPRERGTDPEEALLPLGRGCRDAAGNLCPVRSDPYSFRVTVVVPYWPRRFRNPDFRPFFERTLRLETPAHVFPRICWVDVCQMQQFEDAYRRWLRAMAHPTGDCDRPAAQNALVDILFRLKSVYRTARLFGCTSEGVANPLRLDQTILGTGGTDHDNSR